MIGYCPMTSYRLERRHAGLDLSLLLYTDICLYLSRLPNGTDIPSNREQEKSDEICIYAFLF